uniref:Uncharacterized protein n=1 Tax=Utricularia reniformis TaxID=192314 RepID=A0A1Y0AYR0_9LAMI|nr:hypothetical protein AEK19_MT0631 [Utricularia reniformis]ART30296.1 hypothetical protein AEK19_MT0631 [Utricularia reniformis]
MKSAYHLARSMKTQHISTTSSEGEAQQDFLEKTLEARLAKQILPAGECYAKRHILVENTACAFCGADLTRAYFSTMLFFEASMGAIGFKMEHPLFMDGTPS